MKKSLKSTLSSSILNSQKFFISSPKTLIFTPNKHFSDSYSRLNPGLDKNQGSGNNRSNEESSKLPNLTKAKTKVDSSSSSQLFNISTLENLNQYELYAFFCDNYKLLDQDQITTIFKRLKTFMHNKNEEENVIKVIESLLNIESQITSSDLISEFIQFKINAYIKNGERLYFNIHQLITNKIKYFNSSNIKYVFQFYPGAKIALGTKVGLYIWNNFLKEIIVDEKYFDVTEITLFDFIEIINYCYVEKNLFYSFKSCSLSDNTFMMFLEVLEKKWEKYKNSTPEDEIVEELLENDFKIQAIECLLDNSIAFSKGEKSKDLNLNSKICKVVKMCEECYSILNVKSIKCEEFLGKEKMI